MELITLQAIPNQEVIVTLESERYKIEIKSAGDFMTYGISRDDGTIIENGARLVNGAPLFPYSYMQIGNLLLSVPDDELPNYQNFQSTQFLYYATAEELAQ